MIEKPLRGNRGSKKPYLGKDGVLSASDKINGKLGSPEK